MAPTSALSHELDGTCSVISGCTITTDLGTLTTMGHAGGTFEGNLWNTDSYKYPVDVPTSLQLGTQRNSGWPRHPPNGLSSASPCSSPPITRLRRGPRACNAARAFRVDQLAAQKDEASSEGREWHAGKTCDGRPSNVLHGPDAPPPFDEQLVGVVGCRVGGSLSAQCLHLHGHVPSCLQGVVVREPLERETACSFHKSCFLLLPSVPQRPIRSKTRPAWRCSCGGVQILQRCLILQ